MLTCLILATSCRTTSSSFSALWPLSLLSSLACWMGATLDERALALYLDTRTLYLASGVIRFMMEGFSPRNCSALVLLKHHPVMFCDHFCVSLMATSG